jgi:RHS repeat-associated protein
VNATVSSPTRVDNDSVWDQGAGLPVTLQDVRTPQTGSATTTTYLYGLDLISRTDGSGNQEYHLYDGLGSTVQISDDDGDVTDSWTYDVFGAERSHSGASDNEFTYAGEQTDGTGLQYLRARYYDPATGRFLNEDPLPLLQRYAYAGNNPSNFVDPTGLVPGGDVTKEMIRFTTSVISKSACWTISWDLCKKLWKWQAEYLKRGVTGIQRAAEQAFNDFVFRAGEAAREFVRSVSQASR